MSEEADADDAEAIVLPLSLTHGRHAINIHGRMNEYPRYLEGEVDAAPVLLQVSSE